MHKWEYILLVLLFSSCTWLTPKEELKAAYVAAQLKAVDWESVDEFPLFKGCDETVARPLQQACFEGFIKEELAMVIQQMNAVDSLQFSGSFSVSFVVDIHGKIVLEPLLSPPFNNAVSKQFKQLVHQQFKHLPALAPALKRGIPVATRFKIPIEIHLD